MPIPSLLLVESKKKLAAEFVRLVALVQYDTPPLAPVPVKADDPVQVTIWFDELTHSDEPAAEARLFKVTEEFKVEVEETFKVFKYDPPDTTSPPLS